MVDILYFSFLIHGGVSISEPIVSMTIKHSYVDACVCVDLLKALLVVLCVLLSSPFPSLPDFLGPCEERAQL